MFNKKIGIDLGTVNILVYEAGKGIVIKEPSVVALEKKKKEVLAVGSEAREMLGKTPGNIIAVRPLKGGVIADFKITEKMLKYLLSMVLKRNIFFRPIIMICVPAGITEVEKRAVIEVGREVGARDVYLIEEPLAAAIGAGLPIERPGGNMVIDIGGGTTEIAVISMSGIVISESIRLGGDSFDEEITRYIREKYNVIIGEKTAEEIKKEVGTAVEGENKCREIRGRHLTTGLPKKITINARETVEAFEENIYNIVEGVRGVLEQTPPELASDIMDKGVVITGGGALLNSFCDLLSDKTGIPVFLDEDPLSSVARGTGQALKEIEKLENMLTSSKEIDL
ncbi:MAG: rod shape-determining protein [Halanaerobiaceae bacterium]